MRAIFKIIGIMIVIYFVSKSTGNSYIFSGSSGLLFLAGLSFLAYALYKIIINPSVKANQKSTANKPVNNTKKNWTYVLLATAILIFFLQKLLGMISYRFFLFMDNLLRLSDSVHPVVMWAVIGLFTGLIYGSFVAWKKYKLEFKLNLIPIGIFLFIVFILFIVNEPLNSEPINTALQPAGPKENEINTDSIKKFIVNRWKTVDVIGKNREKFLRIKNSVTSELELKKNGKCYMNKNGVRKATFYYTIAPDGKSLLFTDPDKTEETVPVQIISITKDELVITSAMYHNDTVLFKAK